MKRYRLKRGYEAYWTTPWKVRAWQMSCLTLRYDKLKLKAIWDLPDYVEEVDLCFAARTRRTDAARITKKKKFMQMGIFGLVLLLAMIR